MISTATEFPTSSTPPSNGETSDGWKDPKNPQLLVIRSEDISFGLEALVLVKEDVCLVILGDTYPLQVILHAPIKLRRWHLPFSVSTKMVYSLPTPGVILTETLPATQFP